MIEGWAPDTFASDPVPGADAGLVCVESRQPIIEALRW